MINNVVNVAKISVWILILIVTTVAPSQQSPPTMSESYLQINHLLKQVKDINEGTSSYDIVNRPRNLESLKQVVESMSIHPEAEISRQHLVLGIQYLLDGHLTEEKGGTNRLLEKAATELLLCEEAVVRSLLVVVN